MHFYILLYLLHIFITTLRNAYTREKDHLSTLERREEISVLCKHSRDNHEGYVLVFVMNIMGTFRKNAMLRQTLEQVLINKVQESQSINSKIKWN